MPQVYCTRKVILLLTRQPWSNCYHSNTTLFFFFIWEQLAWWSYQKVVGEQKRFWYKDELQSGSPDSSPPRITVCLLWIMLFAPLLLFRLLYSVLPPSVANELRHKRPVPAKRYDNVTILFSGIVGFNAFCSKHASAEGAIKIVNLLNDVYTRFDILTDSRKNPYVYKVGNKNVTTAVYQAFV